jgi:hypothetical protein
MNVQLQLTLIRPLTDDVIALHQRAEANAHQIKAGD